MKLYFQKILEYAKNLPLRRQIFLGAGTLSAGFFLWLMLAAPCGFPVNTIIEIPKGTTISQASDILKSEGIISSTVLFRAYLKIFKSGDNVLAGDYFLSDRESFIEIANRMTSGDFRIPRAKVLITEGEDVYDIAKTIKDIIPSFDDTKFLALARSEEGYLFPDTYFFLDTVTPEDVISTMKNNFEEKILPLQAKISASGHSLSDIITMASIVEREAVTPKDRRIVAGILWRRISIDMRLQVDATFDYINGKGSASLTMTDLKSDSPYNTYTHKGLPPGPIANPGLDTILATLEPTPTLYLYYLSDKDGAMHYARTFEEHKANKIKYIP